VDADPARTSKELAIKREAHRALQLFLTCVLILIKARKQEIEETSIDISSVPNSLVEICRYRTQRPGDFYKCPMRKQIEPARVD